jgi:hypothetical protein
MTGIFFKKVFSKFFAEGDKKNYSDGGFNFYGGAEGLFIVLGDSVSRCSAKTRWLLWEILMWNNRS